MLGQVRKRSVGRNARRLSRGFRHSENKSYKNLMNERRIFCTSRAANLIFRLSLVLCTFFFLSPGAFGQSDCRIIITTPGYGSIYRYAPEEFAAQMASDFKIEGVTVDYETLSEGCKRLKLHIGRKDFVFSITPQSPVARLTYDRNRRQFKGIGFNYIEREGVRYEAPSFKGLTVEKLSEAWQPQIERLIENRSLLEEDEPNVFLLEADIDEHGNVHKIVELSGALRQYSQIFIDKVYDMAVRGWQPAKKDGVPFRTVCQLRFVLTR